MYLAFEVLSGGRRLIPVYLEKLVSPAGLEPATR